MAAQAKHRDKIVRSAAVLFRRYGYAASGTNDIVALSGAPKGSLYHYFPRGKEQIAEEVIAYAGELVRSTLARLCDEHDSPGAIVRAYSASLAGWMAESGYRDGCPISTILLEIAIEAEGVAQAGKAAFAAWEDVLATAFEARKIPRARAVELAGLAVCSWGGALVVAKAARSSQPIQRVAETLARQLDDAVRDAGPEQTD
ncbi:TetR/AcrR family transcriptional regulator [Cupriavidus basilensis]|uniref:TetR/AcrR family transcriptional regulator n=1 Tax=Cupriavidus basilensis TaxID=68895 RepID=A0ABT6AKN8_9BURK|nr:TetR/AcrR family transcriptional regulator [Cupriavidus basilensis]MDF3833019.1 TetR/AcrR family transcriptional regulator [Cupriavidus basilensis]